MTEREPDIPTCTHIIQHKIIQNHTKTQTDGGVATIKVSELLLRFSRQVKSCVMEVDMQEINQRWIQKHFREPFMIFRTKCVFRISTAHSVNAYEV